MKPPRVVLLLGVVVLGVVVGLALRERAVRPSATAAAVERPGGAPLPARTSGNATPGAGRPAQRPRATVARMDLPPPNTPVGPVFDALVRAARAGDPGAMCRLSFEGHRCDYQLRQFREQEEMATDLLVYGEPEARGKEQLLQQLRWNAAKLEELETVCAGVVLPPDLKPWRLLRDAARAGHVPSMLRFAESPPIEFETIFEDLDAIAALRDERAVFLRRAAEAGNAKAAYVLFQENTGSGNVFGRRNRDPVLALAYGLSLEGIGNESTIKHVSQQVAMLRRKLGAAERQKAERLAATLAPGFASARGADVDLRRGIVDDGSDCAATDPRTLTIRQPKPAPATER